VGFHCSKLKHAEKVKGNGCGQIACSTYKYDIGVLGIRIREQIGKRLATKDIYLFTVYTVQIQSCE